MQRSVEDRDARVAGILEEYLAGARAGRPPDREALLKANEDVRKELGAALTALEFVGKAGEELADDEERGAPRPEGTLGDFRLIREVGRGGMGVVYEAEQISLSRRVALKVLPFASVLDEQQLQRFRHEAQAAALLHHTNIVPVHSVGTERGVHYYAMEFVEGRTLAAVIQELRGWRRPGPAARARASRRAPRPPPVASESSSEVKVLTAGGSTETPEYCRAVARLGVQAAEALDHAHAHDVVHRDIKPANLMVDAGGRLWITDFGLARSRANPQLTLTGAIVGTLGYMSPEQALGKRVPVDHRTDIYSLGITLLEALTLDPPFAGEDPHEVIQQIAFKSPTPPRKTNAAVPRALETILMKAVAKDPESRYTTAREMAEDLRRFLADEPIRARREPVLERATLWVRRHRAAVAAAACVLVVAVLALAADLVRVGAQKKRAEDAAAEARRNAARAEENFARAREAIDEMLTQVGAEELEGIPGLEAVRRKLLAKAAHLYEAMLASAGDDEGTRLEAARAFVKLGEVCSSLGDKPEAERHAERARTLLVALAPEDGPWHPALHELAHAELLRAQVLGATGRLADALPVLEHAVALAERGAREQPDDPHMNPCLSEILEERCQRLFSVGRHAEAEAAGRRAVRVQEIAIERAPHDQGLHEGLGGRLGRLGDALRAMGSTAEAEAAWRRAIQELEPAASGPADSDGFWHRATGHSVLAAFLLDAGRVDDALPLLRIADEAAARRASEFPAYPKGQFDAARHKGMLAAALYRAGQEKEAEEALADAIARYDRLLAQFRGHEEMIPGEARHLIVIGNHLGHAGRRAEADAAFRRGADLARARARAMPDRAAVKAELAGILSNWVGNARDRLAPAEQLSLCREAVKVAEESISLPDAVPESRSMLFSALSCLGETLSLSGELDDSADAWRRAAAIGADLLSRSPGEPRLRQRVAVAQCAAANCLRRGGRLDEAEQLLRPALATLEELASAPKGDVQYAKDLRYAASEAALLGEQRGRLPEAETFARRAVAVAEAIVARSPEDALERRILAEMIGISGRIQLALGHVEDAEQSLARALDEFRRVIREWPQDPRTKRQFLMAVEGIVRVQLGAGRGAEAAHLVEEAVRVTGEAAATQPDPRNRRCHVDARLAQIWVLVTARAEEAEREHRALLELLQSYEAADGADAYRWQRSAALRFLASIHESAGRDRDAIEALERALELSPYRSDAVVHLVLLLGDAADPACRNPRRAVELARDAIARAERRRSGDEIDARGASTLLAYALICDGRWTEGLEAAARSAELGHRENGGDWIYHALARVKLGDLAAARDLLDRAVAWFDEHPSPDERFARRRAEVERLLAEAEPR